MTPYSFDIGRCVVADMEVYPGRWCLGLLGPDRQGKQVTLVVKNDRAELTRLLNGMARNARILVGFNSTKFDVPVIRAILGGFDPYAIGNAIIAGGRLPVPLSGLPLLPCDHIDVSARLRRGGGFPGLKRCAAYLGRPVLRELPFAPGSILDDEQWMEVLRYNAVDLGHTWALLERFAPELQALAALAEEQGQDLRSTPTPRVVEQVFLDAYKRQRGLEPLLPETPLEVIYRPLPGVRRPRTPEAAAWYDRVVDSPLPVIRRGERPRPDVPAARFAIGRLELSVGAGGLHSVDSRRVHYATREHRLVSVDVASFYPSLIASKGISPRAYGDSGAATYRGILERRLDIKKRAKGATDPEERGRLEIQATALKLVLNSTFGKLGDPYSTLFDPAAFLAVTITGQLMLIDLIERLTAVKVRVLSANTDGLFIKVRRKNRRWRQVLKAWEADTEMVLEVDALKRLAILASNRFAVRERSGKVKRRGAGVKGDLSPLAAPNNLIVADAVVQALLHDVPPERTVRDCTDPVRFCSVTQTSSKVKAAVLVNEADGSETELPKVVRWYRARDSQRRIVHRFEDGRHTTPANAVGVSLALDLAEGRLPEDLDFGWYVGQARKVIQSIPGYHHRARRLLLEHPAALDLLERGLVPVPKHGKAQPKGSDRGIPTYLWDWPDFETLGTYTGPDAGILVLDIDDATRFKLCVDKGNSPLLEDRWRDLNGCLVSCRGEASPEDVRTGKARGKLLFRFVADDAHPLVRMRLNHWTKTRGVEVFYGQGIPSVLGKHPDGDEYRLAGTLGEPPGWLIEILTPRKRLTSPRAGGPARMMPASGTNDHPAPSLAVEPAVLDGLPRVLAEIAPDLGKASVGWRTKDLGDGRLICVGRCPYPHDSGTSTDGDLSAGYNQDGRPYVCCMHASCTKIPEINRRLAETLRPATAPAAEPPALEPTEIALAMAADLQARRVALHRAPTGSGKSYSIAQVAVLRYRAGLTTVIAVPTLRLAREVLERLEVMAPDAMAVDAVAEVFGHRPSHRDGDIMADGDGESAGEEEPGEYPIRDWTRIVVCTHAQLGRRGFSKYLRAVWTKLGEADGKDGSRPPFALIIDEAGALVRECRREIPFAHRARRKGDPDGSGGRLIPLRDCPKSSRSGNCHTCELRHHGGEPFYNTFAIRELGPPGAIRVDGGGKELRTPLQPLIVAEAERREGPKVRVGDTTFAAELLAWQGKPVAASTRRTAPIFLFRKDETGRQDPETPQEVIVHMLEFAFRPVITWEYAVNAEGKIIGSAELRARDELAGIVYPWATCEVPRLRFADLAGLEQMRRFAQEQQVGIIFAGATLIPDDADVLREVWPELLERSHPYPARKIRQAAVVFLDGRHATGALLNAGRLVTGPLEELGLGLVFCTTRSKAEVLYKAVRSDHPSTRLAAENDEVLSTLTYLHESAPLGCYVTYSRGVLGHGANIRGIRFLVVDALAFRAIASFTPGTMTPEAFERARAEERLELMLQNIGRALRGEEGKTVVMIVLNADAPLRTAIETSPAIVEGSELPPVFATGDDLGLLVDQARRWFEAGGGDWPEPDPTKAVRKRAGRPRGSATRTEESILAAAETALAARTTWREFRRKEHPERVLAAEKIAELKARFKGKASPDDG
jgi:hypothetical protein